MQCFKLFCAQINIFNKFCREWPFPDDDIDTNEVQNKREKHINKNETIDKDFTLDELKTVIHKLNSGESPGLYDILNELMKYSFPVIGETLTCPINIILNTGHISDEWCVGVFIKLKNKGYKNKG